MTARDSFGMPDPSVVRRLPYGFAKSQGVIAARAANGAIELWLRPDAKPEALQEARRVLAQPVHPQYLDQAGFERALSEAYSHAGDRATTQAEAIIEDFDQSIDLSRLAADLPAVTDLMEAEQDAPIIKLINALLTEAIREGASDIHFEIFEGRSSVRFRVDGELRDALEPQRAIHAAMVARIKIMASLDIAEKRLPQDGRISLKVAGRPVDVRVSTLPTANGERVVLRLLDKQAGRLTLEALGMNPSMLQQIDALIRAPHGIVLVTGPTGSGKTTTLYAALSRLDRTRHNIMTVEDPIEYELDGIGQTQVNPRIELNFARSLRAILRQDPDVIMIGEIRDLETAQIAVQASLTGHLVLATLHTNDSVSAVTRLADMGIEPYLLASSLNAVLAQRLVRKLCGACRAPDVDGRGYRPVGCTECGYTGYAGRTGIYELLVIDDNIRRGIHDGASEAAIREHARKSGMNNLREDGERWIESGVTSREEVLRATIA